MVASGFFVCAGIAHKGGCVVDGGLPPCPAAQQFFESHPGRCNGLSSGICAARGERLRDALCAEGLERNGMCRSRKGKIRVKARLRATSRRRAEGSRLRVHRMRISA